MTKSMNDHLTAFLEIRKQEGYRDNIGVKNKLKKFFEYLDERNLCFAGVRLAEAQAYQGWLIEQKRYTAGSIGNFIKGAKAFYDYLKKAGVVSENAFYEIQRMRVDKKLPRNILKEKEMNRLLSAMRNFDGTGELWQKQLKYRMHVLAEVLYSTACRISEAASIKTGDIDFKRGVIEVKDVKNGYKRIVYLNDYAKEVLRLYVTEMQGAALTCKNNKKMLFGAKGNRLCVLISLVIAETAKRENLPSIKSHGFRHAVGYHLLRAGCGIRQIQEILGHRRLSSTEIYTKVDKDDLKDVLDRFHPRASAVRAPRIVHKGKR